MSNVRPRVSIGLPVFNGENYLNAALDSILAQTYSDFELIISDNASVDRTEEICREYAARDGRIRYYRNETNIGGPKNFNRTFELSVGQYFKWAHHDDVLAPEFLAKCVEVLDRDPSIILVHSKTARIDENGLVVGSYDHELRVDLPKPDERFHDLVRVRHWCYEQFGLIRSSVLKKMPLHGAYIGQDRRLMAELALRGRWHMIPEYLFLRRQHSQAESNVWPLQARLAWHDPTKAGRICFPHFRELFEYVKCIQRVPLRLGERLSCYATLWKYTAAIRNNILDDLKIAAVMLLHRSRLGRDLIAVAKRFSSHRATATPHS